MKSKRIDTEHGIDTSSDEDTTATSDSTGDELPIALEERLTSGSKTWAELQKDKVRQNHRSSFPARTTARTTLWANDASDNQVHRFELLFLLQHGRQHPAEPRLAGYSEDWDGHKVRQEEVGKFRRAETILSQAEVSKPVRDWAISRLMSNDLRGFSRHYEGIDGAAIGFATLYKYDDVGMAKNSYLVDEAERMLGIDGEQLVEYVWRKYGGVGD